MVKLPSKLVEYLEEVVRSLNRVLDRETTPFAVHYEKMRRFCNLRLHTKLETRQRRHSRENVSVTLRDRMCLFFWTNEIHVNYGKTTK